MFNIVFVEPEIPQNTGSTARLCAATGATLHLVGKLGFSIDDAAVKRAGLDYWEHVNLKYHPSIDALKAAAPLDARFLYFSSSAETLYTDIQYRIGDFLVFGKESVGLPRELLEQNRPFCFRIPIRSAIRSLNIATAAGVVLYEALRQHNFSPLGL